MKEKLQYAAVIFTVIASIWGGIWAISDKIATAEDLARLESMTLATFKTLQDGLDARFLQQQLAILQDRKYRIREEMRKNPNDPALRQDYESVCQEIRDTEAKLMRMKK